MADSAEVRLTLTEAGLQVTGTNKLPAANADGWPRFPSVLQRYYETYTRPYTNTQTGAPKMQFFFRFLYVGNAVSSEAAIPMIGPVCDAQALRAGHRADASAPADTGRDHERVLLR